LYIKLDRKFARKFGEEVVQKIRQELCIKPEGGCTENWKGSVYKIGHEVVHKTGRRLYRTLDGKCIQN